MQPPGTNHLLFIGASARWAAQCAAQAGYLVSAIDMFGDTDLHSCARHWDRLRDWEKICELVKPSPAARIVLLGGMEHVPGVIDRLAKAKVVLGATSGAISIVRAPGQLDLIAAEAGIQRPERRDRIEEHHTGWIRKQCDSTGGLGVVLAESGHVETLHSNAYFERMIPGRCYGISFLATADQTHLVFAAASLRSCRRPMPFAYEGSLGPIKLPTRIHQSLQRLGALITEASGIRGLFGVDVIIDPQQRLWLLEVNPRLTASMELADRHGAMIDLHVGACTGQSVKLPELHFRQCVGKRVFYAPCEFQFSVDVLQQRVGFGIRLADIPADGTVFGRGEPVCSLLARMHGPLAVSRTLSLAVTAARRVVDLR